ncbi:MAG: hypothetical protein NTY46_06120 [Candidatus Sumerlaeota bacterium]|nr:hypothetical protein [Candidatus Sumerlaeota bacterium]
MPRPGTSKLARFPPPPVKVGLIAGKLVRLALAILTAALEQAVGFMQDVSADQLPGDQADADPGDPPVMLPHVVLTLECHARSTPSGPFRPVAPILTGPEKSAETGNCVLDIIPGFAIFRSLLLIDAPREGILCGSI